MNKVINAILLLLIVPTMGLSIYVGFDLPIEFLKTSGAQLTYRYEMFLLLGTLILVVNLRRSIRRWVGAWMISKKDRFLYNESVNKQRVKRINVYLCLESLVMISVSYAFYRLTAEAWMPIVGLMFGAIDNIVFMLLGNARKLFRIAISSKAVISADREVSVLYFEGMRELYVQQQTIYFEYIKGLQLSFPTDTIAESNKTKFKSVLEAQIDRDQVFVSENFKSF